MAKKITNTTQAPIKKKSEPIKKVIETTPTKVETVSEYKPSNPTLDGFSLLELEFIKKELVSIVNMYKPNMYGSTSPFDQQMYNIYNPKLEKVQGEIKKRIDEIEY